MCTHDAETITGPAPRSGRQLAPSFTVVPVSGNVIIGGGNIATCSGNDDEKTAGILDTVSGVVYTTGNAAYPNGTDSAYTNCFNPSTTWGRHKSRILPSPGDQDYNTANATGYYNYFGTAAGDPTKGYYSYDVGNWHIVVLNSSLSVVAGSPEETWLRSDLAANGKPCTLAYWQLPLYSSGQSGSQSKVRPLFQAMYDYGGDVVLNGKDRDYERFAPQDANGNADPVKGVREFVVGTGGAGNSSSFRSTILPNSEARYIASSGLLKLTLNPTSYSWLFIPVKGTVPDSGTATCSGADQPPVANAGGPYTGAEGSAVSFNGSGSSDPDNDPLTYDWNFGDGSTHGTGVSPTHTYVDNGSYTVTLTVNDGKGGTNSTSTTATISNVAPTATFTAPATVVEGTAIALSLTNPNDASSADVTAGFSYAFDCGLGAGYGAFGPASSASCPTQDNGTRTVKGQVRDKDGGVSEYTASVTITNAAPVITAVTGPSGAVNLGTSVQVQASFTDAGVLDTHTASLDWGDASSSNGTVTETNGSGSGAGTHTYAKSGVYTVKVTVTDKDGGTDSKSTQVTINGPPVISSSNGPYTANEGAIVSMTVTATDPEGDPITYDWDFGDGTAHGTGASVTHVYADNGSYTVTVVATDSHGAASAPATTSATIANVAPTATFQAPTSSVNEGSAFTLSLTSPVDPSTADVAAGFTYAFDCGDGAGYSAYAAATTRSCPTTDNGTRATKGSIKDKDGGITEYTASVTVSNVAPTVDPLKDVLVTLGSDLPLSATFSDPGTADTPWSYHIDWGDASATDGSAATQPGPITASHRYATGGTYTVTVQVKDKDGGSGTSSFHATVNTPPTIASNGGPYTGDEGATIAFTATASDAEGDALTYEWNFGDGSAHATTATASHKYVDNGSYPVTLTVTDSHGASTTSTTTATIANVAPVVGAISGPGDQNPINVPVSISVSFTDAGTADTHTASLDWGDGATTAGTVSETNGSGSVTGTHSYATKGTYTLRVTVTDKDGASTSATRAITLVDPVNRPPVAVVGGPYTGNEAQLITFDGSGSSDPDGDAITYDWDFGDGSAHGTGVHPTHAYGDNGSYTVTLVVTDSKGLAGTASTTTATIANVAPTATFSPSVTSLTEGGTFTLSLTSPSDPSAIDVEAGFTYSFDCGAGAGYGAFSSSNTVTCTAADNATRTVKGEVRDKDGGVTAYTATVTITNVAPVVGALTGPSGSPPAKTSVTVSASFSDAGVLDTHTASIDWGDGTVAPGAVSESGGSGTASGSHTYAAQGTYTVHLTVTDKDGASAWSTTSLTIAAPVNHPPTSVVGGPYSGAEASPIAFNGTASSDPDGDLLSYDWDFGDGSPHGSGPTPSHTYADNGTYTVTLVVNDGAGGTNASSTVATVVDVAPTAVFNSSSSVVEGSSISLSLTSVTDPSTVDVAAGFQYAFDCGDGAGYGPFGSANAASCPTSDNGTRTVRGKVRDKDGGTSEYTATASITNAAPSVSSVTGPSGSVGINASITVTSNFSDAGVADTHTASYDWGDGTTSTGTVTESSGSGTTSGSHAYTAPGSFTVRVTVTDKDGASGSNTTVISVANRAPVANAGGPYSGNEGSAVAFNGSGSSDPDNDVITYDWNFGDGSAHGTGVSPSHTYADNGTYTVTLVVTDSRGLASAPSSTTATIANVPPTATFNAPASVNEGSTFTIQLASPRDPSSADVAAGFTYAFDCGAGAGYGAFGTSTNANCPTTDNATRTVKGKIKDKDGGITEYTATTVVQNVAPTVGALSGPTSAVAVNTPVSVSASFTDPGTSDTHTASINWGDGAVTAGSLTESNGSGSASGTHTYTVVGTYTISLTVTDDDGGSGSNTLSVTVSPPSTSQVLVGAGDIVRCSLTNAEATAKIVDTIPGTVFVAGDNAYENGTLTEYQSCYQPTWGRFFSRTHPTPGNHEYNTPGATGYYQYFGALAGDPSKGYYSYDLGSWHIVVLNSNISTSSTSAQVTWLKADLAASTKTCTLAYWHHPRFDSGEIGNNSALQPLWDALYQYGAEIVINGHEHVYERFAPQTPTGTADPARGIRQFTVGTGGAGNASTWGTIKPNSEVRYLDDFGVLKLTLFDGGYSWRFITVSKPFSDSGTGSCH